MKNQSRQFLLMVVPGLVGVLALTAACTTDAEAPTTEKRGEVIVRDLAAKYEATIAWEENIIYTFQAQAALMTGDPILFRGYVDDVFILNGTTFVRFSSYNYYFTAFIFELDCGQSIVETILAAESFDEFAVVANVQEVSKAVIALRASPLSEDEAEINMSAPDLFTARGSCIEVAHIPRP